MALKQATAFEDLEDIVKAPRGEQIMRSACPISAAEMSEFEKRLDDICKPCPLPRSLFAG
jgi:hypothetical protein